MNLQPDHSFLDIHVGHVQNCQQLWIWHWRPIPFEHSCIIIYCQWHQLIWQWIYYDWHCDLDCLIDLWTEKPGDVDAFRRTRIDWWKKCQPFSSIDYMDDLSTETRRPLSTDTNLGVMGTGHVYSKSDTLILTYRSINKLFDLSMERWNGRRDTSVGQQTPGNIDWRIYQWRRGDPYQRTKI